MPRHSRRTVLALSLHVLVMLVLAALGSPVEPQGNNERAVPVDLYEREPVPLATLPVAANIMARATTTTSSTSIRKATSTTSTKKSSTTSRKTTTTTKKPTTTSRKTTTTTKKSTSTTSRKPTTTTTKKTSTTSTSTKPVTSAVGTATSGASSSTSTANAAFASNILQAHNTARSTHGANALTWSSSVEDYARIWAEKCVWQHGGNPGQGQNLAASAGYKQTGQQSVNAWMSEEVDYDPSNPMYSHFTQVVWKSTTQLGCYQATCTKLLNPDGSETFPGPSPAYFTVCNYSPPGNVYGQYAQNVQKNT